MNKQETIKLLDIIAGFFDNWNKKAAKNDCCEDHGFGIAKLNSYLIFCNNQSGIGNYDGKPFKYCPWCGTKK